MANIAGSGYTSPYTSPTFKYDIAYSEIARNASSVTYRFYIDVYMTSTSSSFGYSLAGYIDVNGAVSYVTFKGTEKWTGTTVHSFQVDVTAPAGSGGGTLNAYFNAYRPGGEGNSGKIDVYGTVNLSTWNTAPYWPTGAACTVSPSGTIPENTASLAVSWTAANDTEGNTRYYTVKRYKNGVYDATIATNITATSVSDNIGAGNQGARYYYTVEVNDGSLTQSAKLQSATVTKNTFTGASITAGGNILYSTSALAMTISGAKNTNGNTSFTYSLACNKVTVYNPTASPGNVTIYKSGALPTGTYIKFDDIKAALAGSGYKGNFVFTLTTTNAYGSVKTATVTVYVDITTTPTAVGAISVTGAFKINDVDYFVPGKRDITVTWGASSDPLGGSITYELQGKIGYDNFVTLATGITGNSKIVSLAAVTAQTFYTFRVIAKTSYGISVLRDAAEITLHYYYTPSVIFDPVVRNVNDAIISGEIKLNTSIPGVTVSALSYSGKTSDSLTLATTFTKQETGLLETDTFNFSVTVRDSAGDIINGTTGVTFSKSVPRYTPMLSIRRKGIGINALADDTYKFVVGGSAKISNDLRVGGNAYISGKIVIPNIIISGTAGSKPLKVRGIQGTDGSEAGTDGELYLNSGSAYPTIANHLTITGNLIAQSDVDVGRTGIHGTYNSSQVQQIWSIGLDYKINIGSNTFGNIYGIGYAYSTTGGAPFSGQHQIAFINGGTVKASVGLSSGDLWLGSALYSNRIRGIASAEIINIGSGACKLDMSGGSARLHNGTNYLSINADAFDVFFGSTNHFRVVSSGDGSIDGTFTFTANRMGIGYANELWTTYNGLLVNYRGGATGGLKVYNGSSSAYGPIYGSSKSAITPTETYGDILTYADESPNHVFHDSGHGMFNDDGICYVYIDPILLETVSTKDSDYMILYGNYCGANAETFEKHPDYFIAKGNPNKEFDWFIRAERKGMERLRWNEGELCC